MDHAADCNNAFINITCRRVKNVSLFTSRFSSGLFLLE